MNGFQEYSCCELPNLLCVMTQSTEPETDCKMDESYVAGTEKERVMEKEQDNWAESSSVENPYKSYSSHVKKKIDRGFP